MKIINIIKQHIYVVLGWIGILILLLIALFHKYDYKQIDSTMLSSDRSCGGPYLEGTYVDAVMKIEGTITEGSIRCYYFHSKDQSQWDNPDELIVIERIYQAAAEIDEEIEIGNLGMEWQCIGMERIGEEQLKQNIVITIEARQYGYQIVDEFLRSIIPGTNKQ